MRNWWYLSFLNFLVLGILAFVETFLFLFGFFSPGAVEILGVPDIPVFLRVVSIAFLVSQAAIVVLWLWTATLFKKQRSLAISLGYVLVGIVFAMSAFEAVGGSVAYIAGRGQGIGDMIMLAVFSYVLYGVRQAHKQSGIKIQENPHRKQILVFASVAIAVTASLGFIVFSFTGALERFVAQQEQDKDIANVLEASTRIVKYDGCHTGMVPPGEYYIRIEGRTGAPSITLTNPQEGEEWILGGWREFDHPWYQLMPDYESIVWTGNGAEEEDGYDWVSAYLERRSEEGFVTVGRIGGDRRFMGSILWTPGVVETRGSCEEKWGNGEEWEMPSSPLNSGSYAEDRSAPFLLTRYPSSDRLQIFKVNSSSIPSPNTLIFRPDSSERLSVKWQYPEYLVEKDITLLVELVGVSGESVRARTVDYWGNLRSGFPYVMTYNVQHDLIESRGFTVYEHTIAPGKYRIRMSVLEKETNRVLETAESADIILVTP